ncbi:MAG: G5 domain-containing protein [Candidatus Berkelbacteria bacterium]|nr:G5 domain-containing protein [Candidatus Berkelbacteria bacterium]
MDKNFIIGRAIALANFQNDEKIVEPEIKYQLPGEGILQNIFFDQTQKIVTIMDPQFAIGGIQAVFKAPKYTIQDGKKTYGVYSFKRGVGEILSGASIQLAKEDMVSPALGSEPADNLIKITRVSLAEIENFETLPYQTKKIDDPTLERGKQTTSQIGKTGKRRLLYLVRREDGIDVSKTLQKNEIVDKPQDEIIKIGTKVIVLSSERGYATVYNPSNCSVISANYKKGTTLRITNQANGAQIIKTVDCTWGSADHDGDVVLDLSHGVLDELRYNWTGKGAMVLVEQLKQ